MAKQGSLRHRSSEPPVTVVYFAIDVSYSVVRDAGRTQDAIMARLVNALGAEPRLTGGVRLSVVQFSDRAAVTLPLSRLGEISEIPRLSGGVGTSYGSLFRLLRDQIMLDVISLQVSQISVRRPLVFLISDGQAGDDWVDEFEMLTAYDRDTQEGLSCFPLIFPIAIGQVDLGILRKVAFPPSLSVASVENESQSRALTEVAADFINNGVLSELPRDEASAVGI